MVHTLVHSFLLVTNYRENQILVNSLLKHNHEIDLVQLRYSKCVKGQLKIN